MFFDIFILNINNLISIFFPKTYCNFIFHIKVPKILSKSNQNFFLYHYLGYYPFRTSNRFHIHVQYFYSFTNPFFNIHRIYGRVYANTFLFRILATYNFVSSVLNSLVYAVFLFYFYVQEKKTRELKKKNKYSHASDSSRVFILSIQMN